MFNIGIGFLIMGSFVLVGRLYMDMTRQQKTEQELPLKKTMMTASIVFFVVGILLMALSLFDV